MILKPVNSMKLNHPEPSMPQQTSNAYFYPGVGWAIGPVPATPEMIKRAQFIDKTYVWRKK
tara:strand:+ start:67 stop:249 length:183 start_codon:yes stop_codon:yes gene_type:complete